ncbi:MAG: hypothetical protein RIC55_16390 [Pirellulaceae bacterium]
MAYFLGTDEAGYGPNLGPLVISASLWQLPSELLRQDLYDVLAEVISRSPCAAKEPCRFAIADSKQLYKPGGGWGAIERGLHAAGSQCFSRSANTALRWRDVWPMFDPDSAEELLTAPWFRQFDAPLPRDASLDDIERSSAAFDAATKRCGVKLLAIRSRVVRAATFNTLLERHGNKAEVLSRLTLELVACLLSPLGPSPIHIQCDKHGGRNRYAPLLQETFPEHLVEIHGEGRARSVYRWGPSEARTEIQFTARGESALPTALASMASKYLRELAMQAFNEFWRQEVPGIRPTAGYPSDARRFRQQIAARQAELGIDDDTLWRRR